MGGEGTGGGRGRGWGTCSKVLGGTDVLFALPHKNITSFHSIHHSELLCKFNIVKDERLAPKMEGKSIFSRHLKQFDGLT